jgi:rod shape-determining protein MreD
VSPAPRASRLQFAAVLAVLLLLHFYVRPRLWDARLSPDFLTVALVIFAMRSSPGTGAVAGFIVGLATDALTPARPGAGALAGTLVGFLASWGRAVFFADNLLVNAGFVAVGVWLRDLVVLSVSGTTRASMLSELAVYGPLQALVTAIFAVLLLIAFREWFAIRLDL